MDEAKVDIIFTPDMSDNSAQPYFYARVPAGFPSPASDYEELSLDLNRHLVKNKAATLRFGAS